MGVVTVLVSVLHPPTALAVQQVVSEIAALQCMKMTTATAYTVSYRIPSVTPPSLTSGVLSHHLHRAGREETLQIHAEMTTAPAELIQRAAPDPSCLL